MAVRAHGALTSKGSFARAKQALKKSRLVQHRVQPVVLENAWNFHGETFPTWASILSPSLSFSLFFPPLSVRAGITTHTHKHTHAHTYVDRCSPHFVVQPRNRFALIPCSKFESVPWKVRRSALLAKHNICEQMRRNLTLSLSQFCIKPPRNNGTASPEMMETFNGTPMVHRWPASLLRCYYAFYYLNFHCLFLVPRLLVKLTVYNAIMQFSRII